MSNKSSKLLAPIVIAGITVGFLASAYKFVFAKPKQTHKASKPLAQEADAQSEIASSLIQEKASDTNKL